MKFLVACLLAGAHIFLFVSSAAAEAPGSHLLLLAAPNVQREIGITPSQQQELARLKAEYEKEVTPFHAQHDQRAMAMLEASRRAYDERARKVLTKDQLHHLHAIEAKILGPWLLHAPSVRELLGLDERQTARVRRSQERAESLNQHLLRKVQSGKISNEERVKRLRDFRIRESRSLERILTPQQLEALRALAKKTTS